MQSNVVVAADLCVDGGVKLTSLDVNGDFYVEICHDGKYLQVCGDDWDTFDATVACRLAGFGKCKKLVVVSYPLLHWNHYLYRQIQ